MNIKNLWSSGVEFFADIEGYMNDLTEDELSVWCSRGDSNSGGGIIATFSLHSKFSVESVVMSLKIISKSKH